MREILPPAQQSEHKSTIIMSRIEKLKKKTKLKPIHPSVLYDETIISMVEGLFIIISVDRPPNTNTTTKISNKTISIASL